MNIVCQQFCNNKNPLLNLPLNQQLFLSVDIVKQINPIPNYKQRITTVNLHSIYLFLINSIETRKLTQTDCSIKLYPPD